MILSILISLVTLLFIIGLYRPWVVLWWMSYSNRWRVIKYYGLPLLLLLLLKMIV